MPVSYTQQIRPILSDKCFECHGPDESSRAAGLRLDSFEDATADLGGYAAIKPGDPKKSEFITRILSDQEDRMPPAHKHKDLTAEEKELLKKWVAQGAKYEQHWSFRKLTKPAAPGDGHGAAIDSFLQRRLKQAGVQPAEPAKRETLARRLYLDLLGVPPTLAEVDSFASDAHADAWPRLVDRLLDDPRFGERLAVYWLDLVRYADTIGYHSDNFMEVSSYRDYVVDAFNRNLPYDQFTAEQIAGDLLEEPTRQQLIASGYNRLLQTTEEGGSQPKEYIAIYQADRVRNVSSVWLGVTMGCAQCHDHKYDPLTMKDFYSMGAFFADVAEQPVGARDYNYFVPSSEQDRKLAQFDKELEQLRLDRVLAEDSELRATVDRAQQDWEAAQAGKEDKAPTWDAPRPTRYESDSQLKFNPLPDNSIYVSNASPYSVIYDVTIPASGVVRSIRLDTMTHYTFRGENRFSNRHYEYVLTEFIVTVDGKQVEIASGEAEFVQPGFPIHQTYDGNLKTGWAIAGHPKQDRISAVFRLKKPLELGDEPKEVRVQMAHSSIFGRHHIGRFRVSFSPDAKAPLAGPDPAPREVLQALATPREERTAQAQQHVTSYYRMQSQELAKWRARRDETMRKKIRMEDGMKRMLVSESLSKPRMVRVLPRGNWQDDSGEVVAPATPAFLTDAPPTDRRLTRLDLANWITRPDNPLTARVFVNRLWKLLYGRGISQDLGDLGGQGQPPTHPELLDWLAAEFIESGWDVKHMVRLMVTADAYRMASVPSTDQLAADPLNRLFSRQNRWRIEAEFVRDTALSVSRLLREEHVGGVSVKPYQPAGYWANLNFPTRRWHQGKGESLYRRSLYTFWCRTFLHPSLIAFDAPSREECTAMRARSNIPQQVLVLMNDPIFVEAARAFAERIVKAEGTPAEKAAWALREAQLRDADQQEAAILAELFESQRKQFAGSPKDAAKLISVGETKPPADVDPVELAAWTQVARAILSAYETTSRF